MIQQLKFLGMLFALGILVGCSSAGSSGGGSSPVPTATLTANPPSFTIGHGASTLTFTSTNATQGTIDNGEGAVGANGSVQVTPTAPSTTYTFTATGPGGTAYATATVNVTPLGPAPAMTSFSATPAAIIAGQPVILTWSSNSYTSSVAIEPNPGGVQLSGTGTVFPTATTTYTATATGNYQQASASQTIQVSPLNSADGMLPDSTNAGQQDIDPNGAASTHQYMEYVNTEYQAFDKGTLAPVPIAGVSGPQLIGTPFSTALNGPATDCAGTGIQLDAVINFDRIANRWVIAAKAVRAAGVQHRYDLCIAVSNIDDVTATNSSGAYTFGWYAYEFQLDGVLGQNGGFYYFPDWPKLGTWPDAYYATMDMQDTTQGDAEVGVVVCAFDRVNMITGGTMRTPQCIQNTNPSLISDGLYLAHSLIPADFDGTTLPPTGRDEFLVSIQNPSLANGMSATTSNTFNLWDFHVDWTTPSATFTLLTPPTVTTYTPGCYLFIAGAPAITNCVGELQYQGVGQTIDSVGDRFMPRFDYRNFGSYESFLVSHTIQTGPGENSGLPNPVQTGVRWYELRADVNGSSSSCDSGTLPLSSTPVVCQTGTINPDALLSRFLPSIAQDKVGNAAVGYSYSNSLSDPGIAFSYWGLGTLNATASEITIFQGQSEEVTTSPVPGRGQWGSYSSMTIDPSDDCTFWYLNEYWPTTTNWATRIANFKVPSCN